MIRIIINLKEGSEQYGLAMRAARYMVERPDKQDALLDYGDSNHPPRFYVRRNKASISVWEQ